MTEKLDSSSDSCFETYRKPFKHWLLEHKQKSFNDLSSKKIDHYFDKFCTKWNSGQLDEHFYDLAPQQPERAIKSSQHLSAVEGLQRKRELESEAQEKTKWQEQQSRKKQRREEREEIKDNKATGKDRLGESRREKRESNRDFANRKDDTDINFHEDTLMGTSDSFQAAVRARNLAQARRDARRSGLGEDKAAEYADRKAVYDAKESETMKLLKELAQSRFG